MSMILIRVLHQHRRVRHTLAKSRFFLIEGHNNGCHDHCKKILDARERGVVFVESSSQKHATTCAQTLNSAILLGWLVRCSRLAILSSIMLGSVYGILKVFSPSVRSIGAFVIWKCFSMLQREGELEEGTKVRGNTVKFELKLEGGGDSAGAATRSSFLPANLNLIP